jgi:hypothetical protein
MNAIADRQRTAQMPAIVATWLAFVAALLVGGEIEDLVSLVVAAAIGAALVHAGFAAASGRRVLPQRSNGQRARLALVSLAIGIGLGLANLGANMLIVASHADIRAAFDERVAALDPLQALIVSPIVEEIAVRLFLLSGLAWIVFRLTPRARLAFAVGLIGSAVVFALLHLDRPMPSDPMLANYYRAALLVKYTLAGLPLGWVFWRWGLGYAIVCHVAGNAAHLALQEGLF